MVRSNIPDLSSSGTIILFTPVIEPIASGKAAKKLSDNVDPFEALGRALSRHHRRICHVPYVPEVGFTETHDVFISQADVVLVVVCEPNSGRQEGLADQVNFAEAAQDALESSSSSSIRRSHDENIILIQCGDLHGKFWPDLSQFDTMVKSRAYDAGAAQEIARKLFEPRK